MEAEEGADPSTVSTSHHSNDLCSSPELDLLATPDTTAEDYKSDVAPKVEAVDEGAFDDIYAPDLSVVAGATTAALPRKRGRPRKYQLAKQDKPLHARSKTGCATCRRRKKKCDETKPVCSNCAKNNLVCDGYEPRQQWQGGRTSNSDARSIVMNELPMLIDGIEGPTDRLFFQYFTSHVGKVLSLSDPQNPLLEIIVPLSFSHLGLMHSLLYLSGSCLIARDPKKDSKDWTERQEYHSSKAMLFLQRDIADAAARVGAETHVLASLGDSTVAQTLLFCLQAISTGDTSGQYRIHLNAMKDMLVHRQRPFSNEHLGLFILDFVVYHDYSSSITSLTSPLDQRSATLLRWFHLPESILQPQADTFLGGIDGLFGLMSRTRHLRDQIRERRAMYQYHWWDEQIMNNAFAIDSDLRAWQCVHTPESLRFITSLLYRQCTWIYLHRTIQLSRPSPSFRRAVDEGLTYLRALHVTGLPAVVGDSTNSILLMPLFVLGCAAFEPSQRPELRQAFERLQQWCGMANVRLVREIVEQMWTMMDQGKEAETWEWEGIIAARGWDFLVA